MVPMAQWVGQHGSEAVGPGWSLCRAKYFYDFTDIRRKFQWSHGTVGRTTGFWSGSYGFEFQPLPTFFNLIIGWYPPPSIIFNIFRYQKFFETPKSSPTKCFGTVRQNNDGKSWYPPPLLSLTFFDTGNFLKHRRVPLQNVSVLRDKKKFRRKIVIRPFLHEIFRYPKFFEKPKNFPKNFFRYYETNFWRKIVILPPPLPLYP